ncbi:uncharacterized protein SPAPADRAFT_48750 [Spathaspora passalidarum NRRL Y-27907]|uniref:Centrosomin N-terminal motif 1 domain-containing protein n=1 Tax=Spathaspora passalidarum (strain NRRL Y-27907 / 11-Y1) TaxID=619300 RepID=G3AEV8_SPAPN|nr:uncharacterized protein SPAPADRAFT_48750 [Spathaspora passalidarum NRRL Y-27907]EGW35788.1 hypothetical protein SPAPADRAFT_48750 [Spathaspora passalidarum NRRL Y-27907]
MAYDGLLVGTPKRSSIFGRGSRAQEFTPIGEKRHSGFQVIHNYPQNEAPKLFKPIVQNSPRRDIEEEFSQSFYDDDTIDKFDHNSPIKTNVKYDSGKPKSFVNDGGISIKESEERIKQLSAENFSWRLKFMELKKYLDSVPKTDRELMLENVDLKHAIVELEKRLESGTHVRSDNSEYERIIRDKDNQIHSLGNQIHEMEQDILELEDKYRTQQADLDHQQEKFDRLQSSHQNEIVHQQEKLERLQSTQADSARRSQSESNELAEAQHEIQELRNLLDLHNSEMKQLNEDKIEAETKFKKLQQEMMNELEDLHDTHKRDRQEIARLEQEIVRLSEQQQRFNTNDNQLRQERNQLLNQEKDYSSKLSDLQRQLRDKLELEQVLKSKSADLERKLSKKSIEVSNLEQQLSEKTKEVMNLETKIGYLNSKSKGETVLQTQLQQKDIDIDRLETKLKQLEHSTSQEQDQLRELELERGHLVMQLESKDNQLSSLKSQLGKSSDDQDKIRFYEEEYEAIKLELEDKQREVLNYKTRLGKLEQERNKLADRLESDETKFRSSDIELSQLKADNENLERVNRTLKDKLDTLKHELNTFSTSTRDLSKLQIENRKLNEQITTLDTKLSEFQIENRKLQAELDNVSSSNRVLKSEYETLNQMMNSSRSTNSQLDELLQDNRELVERLETANRTAESRSREIRKLELLVDDYKSRLTSRFDSNDYIEDLVREISQLKDKLHEREVYIDRLLGDFDRTRDDPMLESKLKNAQTLIDNYERKIKILEDEILSRERSATRDESPIEAVLELKVQAANEKIDTLSKQISDLRKKQDSDKSIIHKLENEKNLLEDDLFLVRSQQKEISREKERLAGQVSNLDEELERMTRSCRLMSLKAHDYKQQIMKKGDANYEDKFNILEKEAIYYKAKLRDVMMKANDFRMMNTFIMKSITGNTSMYDGKMNLAKLGIYPEYVATYKRKEKLTFKGVAKFVLAAIRLKNRTKKSKVRSKDLKALKSEIECGRIQLDM